MDYYAIGQRVRKFRTSQHLSQEQLAEPVNISTTHMSHIETGNTKLSLQVFCDLASALHVSSDDLLFDGRPSGKAVCTQEIANLLSRCSPSQAQVLKDLLTNYERVADHCSNIAVAMIELEADSFDTHEYLSSVKAMKSAAYERYYEEYRQQFAL